ncbi:MAG: 23S rRNA (adenine(2503)-C(2))-methyltransferase RlmN [Clostridia bacterium]|nr:23S rRNA (adenine(2503)-C(2))-methyltransferase RlmN [Clostridia bacterium]
MKPCLADYNIEELKQILIEMGEKPFRAGQIFKSLHAGLSFDEMTDLSKPLRAQLKEKFIDIPARIIETIKSVDGTEKFLFAFSDGNVIEGVLMRYKYGNTLCVSSQIGCRMNCAFCASGLEGLIRNLSAGEILSEVICVNKYLQGGLGEKRKVTNIVMMGSGEPLDNYDNVTKFLRLVSAKEGLNISVRNISLSTSGLVNKMYDLANENLPVNLTVSLHSPFDDERALIMPVAKKWSIKEILPACDNFFKVTGRRYIFEYVLINGNNDTKRHADALINLLKGKPCHVNLIRLNEVKEKNLKTVTDKEAYRFLGILEKASLSATLRRRMGDDIDGACGQLRRRYLSEKDKQNSNEMPYDNAGVNNDGVN